MAFVLNPFFGDINPGTADGLKLYNKAVSAPETKLSIEQQHAREIKASFENDANNFGWGPATGSIQIDDAAAPATRSILTQAREMTLEMVQKAARRTWATLTPPIVWTDPLPAVFTVGTIDPAANVTQRPQFYRRTRSIMIAKRISASLDKESLTSLMLEQQSFSWTETNGTIHYDGPTMLWFLMSKINPSVRVGISTLKTSLSSAALPTFKHDVTKLLDHMQEKYAKIYADGGEHTDYTLNIFNALETANNAEFLSFVSTERNKWETSTVTATDRETSTALRSIILQKYNNMVQATRWKKTEDPSSQIISALTTKVENLEMALSTATTSSTTTPSATNANPKLRIPVWRTMKTEDKVVRDGKTWWWCPKHKVDGLFDGLYVTHKPEDHDEWSRQQKERRAKKKTAWSTNTSPSDSGNLQLTESMKQALMTDGNMTSDQATALWTKMSVN